MISPSFPFNDNSNTYRLKQCDQSFLSFQWQSKYLPSKTKVNPLIQSKKNWNTHKNLVGICLVLQQYLHQIAASFFYGVSERRPLSATLPAFNDNQQYLLPKTIWSVFHFNNNQKHLHAKTMRSLLPFIPITIKNTYILKQCDQSFLSFQWQSKTLTY